MLTKHRNIQDFDQKLFSNLRIRDQIEIIVVILIRKIWYTNFLVVLFMIKPFRMHGIKAKGKLIGKINLDFSVILEDY